MASVGEIREQPWESILSFSLTAFIIAEVDVLCKHAYTSECTYIYMRSQRSTYESQSSPSAMWVPGNEPTLLHGKGHLYHLSHLTGLLST